MTIRLRGLGFALALELLLALLAPASVAAPKCPNRPVRIAHVELGYYLHDGQGLEAELRDELARRSGCRFESLAMPRARSLIELQAGHVDMTLSAVPSAERERMAWFLPYQNGKNYVLMRADTPASLNAVDFVRDHRLRWGQVRGIPPGPDYDLLVNELTHQRRVEYVTNLTSLFGMFRLARVDAVLATPMVYRQQFSAAEFRKLRRFDWSGSTRSFPVGLLLSRANFDETDAREWAMLLDGIRKDGTLLRMFQRYLPADEAAAHMLP